MSDSVLVSAVLPKLFRIGCARLAWQGWKQMEISLVWTESCCATTCRIRRTRTARRNQTQRLRNDRVGFLKTYARTRVLPLPSVGGKQAGPRLLDDDREESHVRSFRRPNGCLGAAAANRELAWRTANICFAQVDHVFSQGVLLLCSAEEKRSGGLVFPGTHLEDASGSQNTAGFKIQSGSHGSRHTPGPCGAAADRLA